MLLLMCSLGVEHFMKLFSRNIRSYVSLVYGYPTLSYDRILNNEIFIIVVRLSLLISRYCLTNKPYSNTF